MPELEPSMHSASGSPWSANFSSVINAAPGIAWFAAGIAEAQRTRSAAAANNSMTAVAGLG